MHVFRVALRGLPLLLLISTWGSYAAADNYVLSIFEISKVSGENRIALDEAAAAEIRFPAEAGSAGGSVVDVTGLADQLRTAGRGTLPRIRIESGASARIASAGNEQATLEVVATVSVESGNGAEWVTYDLIGGSALPSDAEANPEVSLVVSLYRRGGAAVPRGEPSMVGIVRGRLHVEP